MNIEISQTEVGNTNLIECFLSGESVFSLSKDGEMKGNLPKILKLFNLNLAKDNENTGEHL